MTTVITFISVVLLGYFLGVYSASRTTDDVKEETEKWISENEREIQDYSNRILLNPITSDKELKSLIRKAIIEIEF